MGALFLVEADCFLGATSATAQTVASGAVLQWVVDPGQAMPLEGMSLRMVATGTAGVWVDGVVVAVDRTARLVSLEARLATGSGTYAAWTATTGTLRFSTAPYYTDPDESLPNIRFEPRIVQAGEIGRFMFDRGTTGGASRLEVGDIVLSNADGLLDPLLDYGFDSRAVVIRVGEADTDLGERVSYPGGFTTLLVGTCARGSGNGRDFTLALRTRQFEVDRPLQGQTYAGDNVLPSGLEGTADDLKGSPKPLVFGSASNAPLPCVNTARLIFQANSGPVHDVPAVYDSAVALTRGADYSSRADMEANTPAAGTFRAWLGGGYVRLGSSPAGQVTADVLEAGPAAADRSVAAIVGRILALVPGGYALLDSDRDALLAVQPAEVELWLDEPTTVAEALDRLCGSVGAWWGFDRLGQFRLQRLDAPAGTPAMEFVRAVGMEAPLAVGQADILSLDLYPPQDQAGGLPVQSVALTYGPNWTVQDQPAGSVSAARRAWLARANRDTTPATAAATAEKHPLGEKMRVETLLKHEGDAAAERDRILGMRSIRRDRVVLQTRIDAVTPTLDLGDTVRVVSSRFGYAAGRAFRVTGLRLDARARLLSLDLWG